MKFVRGDVVLVDLEPKFGSEQGMVRPCVIVSDVKRIRASRSRELYMIVPLTRSQTLVGPLAPRLSHKDHGLPADSVALCMHARSVDPKRIIKRVSSLKASGLNEVKLGLKVLLDL